MKKSKLYVFILKSLNKSQKAVQGSHVVSLIASKNPHLDWTRQTFVLLEASRVQLNKLSIILQENDYNSAKFIEPDYDNQLTAFACFGNENEFKQFNLI